MQVSERLVKSGFEVHVLTTDPTGKFPQTESLNGVLVRRFKSWAPSEAYYLSWDLKKYLSDADYDIVHAHSYNDFPALFAAQTKKRNKFVFTPHSAGHTLLNRLLHIPYDHFGKKIFDRADRVICVSNYEKGLIINQFHVPDEKIVVIPNGINIQEFVPFTRDPNVVLTVSRLEKYKGVHFLIEALPHLREEIRLEIVGKGPYKSALLKLIGKLKVQERVRFFEDLSRRELLERYGRAGLFVLLTNMESQAQATLEAIASRTPCLLANTSQSKEWIDSGVCFGIKYPIDLNELVTAIDRLRGKQAGNVKIDLPTWDDVVARLVQVYQSC